MENNTEKKPEGPSSNNLQKAKEILDKVATVVKKFNPNIFADLVGKLISLLKAFFSAERIQLIVDFMKKYGQYVIPLVIMLIPIVGLIIAIRADSMLLFLISIGVSLGLIFCQYISNCFFKTIDTLSQNAKVQLSSDVIPSVFGVLMMLLSIATLVGLCKEGEIIAGILVALPLFLYGTICINNKLTNVEITDKNTPGKEYIELNSFFINTAMKTLPIAYCALNTLILYMFVKAIFASNPEAELLKTIAVAFPTTLLPVIYYLLYIFFYFGIDVIKSILAIPTLKDKQ